MFSKLASKLVLAALCLGLGGTAHAIFHLFQITKLYSNADGSVQFIELSALAAGQQFVSGHSITSTQGGTTRAYNITTNLPGNTAGKTMLFGTAGFAAVAGVAPDYTIPSGFLFTSGGVVNWGEGSDTFAYASLPTTGGLMLNRNGSTSPNVAKNFAGATGSVPSTPAATGPASLENPQPGSFNSGIALFSGWSCDGPAIGLSIDGGAPITVPYGSGRGDVASVCGAGNLNTGFGLLYNFNLIGPGSHTAQLFVNGAARGTPVQFNVVVPAGEFLVGAAAEVSLPNFPSAGRTTRLAWQQSVQNFVIKSASTGATSAKDLSDETGSVPLVPAATGPASLENPQPGSFNSGIALFSGWSCDGPAIGLSIDGGAPITVPYGSGRGDVASVCGASNLNTGFGLLYNFNLIGAGSHTAQLFVNGEAKGTPVQFNVVVPSGEFLVGASAEVSVPNFPATGRTTGLVWQQSVQNFVIKSASP